MRSAAKKWRLVVLLGLCAGFQVPRSPSQFSQTPGAGTNPGRGQLNKDDEPEPFDAKLRAVQLKGLNEIRQKRLVADTDKLLELATQLKDEVEASRERASPANSIAKTDQIAKLAKSVREKMKANQ